LLEWNALFFLSEPSIFYIFFVIDLKKDYRKKNKKFISLYNSRTHLWRSLPKTTGTFVFLQVPFTSPKDFLLVINLYSSSWFHILRKFSWADWNFVDRLNSTTADAQYADIDCHQPWPGNHYGGLNPTIYAYIQPHFIGNKSTELWIIKVLNNGFF